MSKFSRLLPLVVVITLVAAGPLRAQSKVDAATLRSDMNRWMNERVEISGVVTHLVEDAAQSTRFYSLRDDFGKSILIRTIEDPPETNTKVTVYGTVTYEPNRKQLFIHEDQRVGK